MAVVCFLFVSELVESVDNLAAVPLSVFDFHGCTHNGYVELTSSCTNVVPVDKVNVSKLAAVKNAVFDCHCFASAKEY